MHPDNVRIYIPQENSLLSRRLAEDNYVVRDPKVQWISEWNVNDRPDSDDNPDAKRSAKHLECSANWQVPEHYKLPDSQGEMVYHLAHMADMLTAGQRRGDKGKGENDKEARKIVLTKAFGHRLPVDGDVAEGFMKSKSEMKQ